MLLVGDININLSLEDHVITRHFSNITSGLNMRQIVTEPTRIGSAGVPLLDVICVSSGLQSDDFCAVDMPYSSDYMFTYCEIDILMNSMLPTPFL